MVFRIIPGPRHGRPRAPTVAAPAPESATATPLASFQHTPTPSSRTAPTSIIRLIPPTPPTRTSSSLAPKVRRLRFEVGQQEETRCRAVRPDERGTWPWRRSNRRWPNISSTISTTSKEADISLCTLQGPMLYNIFALTDDGTIHRLPM